MEKNTLTIFYDGEVHVYDDVSFAKVQALLLLVGNHDHGTLPTLSGDSKLQTPCPRQHSFLQDKVRVTHRGRLQRELPQARKASLTRFLKARKTKAEETMKLKEDKNKVTFL
ncbi:hypothetical protein KP509_13G094300 [Ceratopteris richardii]|nr:hypothetical protein KP509_13G094300 [Ceratopteris richardii]